MPQLISAYHEVLQLTDLVLALGAMLGIGLLLLWPYAARWGATIPLPRYNFQTFLQENRLQRARALVFGRWFPFWAFALALGVRLINLGADSLWYDETFSAYMTGLDPVTIIRATAGDVHPPLWYLVEWATARLLGNSEFALRLPAALFGALAVVVVFQLGKLYCPRARHAAAAIAIILPGLVSYGQEARMYSLLALLLLLALWGAARGRSALALGAGGLAVYTHNFAIVYLGCFAAWQFLGGKGKPWGWLGGVIGFYVPWLAVLASQVAQVGSGFWLPPLTLPHLGEPLLVLGTGYGLPPLLALGGLGVMVALTVAAIMDRKLYRLAILALAPPAMVALAGVALGQSVYLPRGFIASVPMLGIVWAGWAASQPGLTRWALGGLLALAGVFVFAPQNTIRLNNRSFADSLDIPQGAIVYHTEIGSYVIMSYYAPQGQHYLYPYPSNLSQSLTPATRRIMGFHESSYEVIRDKAAKHNTPVYLIVSTNPQATPAQLDESARIVDTYNLALISEWQANPFTVVRVYSQ